MAKLNAEKVVQIRKMAEGDTHSLSDIAVEFGIDQSAVSRIINGKLYGWVPGELPKRRNILTARYGKDHYAIIGAMGGKRGHTGGFYVNRELARTAGQKGGRISRRGKGKQLSVDGNHETQ